MTNCYLFSKGFVSQIIIIMNFVIISSVGIKKILFTIVYSKELEISSRNFRYVDWIIKEC